MKRIPSIKKFDGGVNPSNFLKQKTVGGCCEHGCDTERGLSIHLTRQYIAQCHPVTYAARCHARHNDTNPLGRWARQNNRSDGEAMRIARPSIQSKSQKYFEIRGHHSRGNVFWRCEMHTWIANQAYYIPRRCPDTQILISAITHIHHEWVPKLSIVLFLFLSSKTLPFSPGDPPSFPAPQQHVGVSAVQQRRLTTLHLHGARHHELLSAPPCIEIEGQNSQMLLYLEIVGQDFCNIFLI